MTKSKSYDNIDDLILRAKEMPSSLNDACRTIELLIEEIGHLRAVPQTLPVRPDSIYSQFHLDNWTYDDFAKHSAATRKTLAYLIELETALALSRPKGKSPDHS